MLSRRAILAATLLAQVAQSVEAAGRNIPDLRLAMHQNTSRAAGFRGSLEGWKRAGIRYVELSDVLLDQFLARDTLAAATKLLGDLGLTPLSAGAVLPDVWIRGPDRVASLEILRRRCEQFVALGLDKFYCPSITNRPVTRADFDATPACIREVGDIAQGFGLTAMIEFARTSTHLSTLASTLQVIRAAGHPAVKPMLDFFHFYSGLSKLEELDLLKPGELAHVHFQDTAAGPRELVDNDSRLIPGDGVAPIARILRTIVAKGYAGALSVELFRSEFVDGDPQQVADRIRRKCDAAIRSASLR
jgi:2-keto-myo-inositol isomerase